MLELEKLQTGAYVRGILADGIVVVKSVTWHGSSVVDVIYEDSQGDVDHRLVYRSDEDSIDLIEMGRPWSFDADGQLLRLVSEAYRISLAWLFDPYLVHSHIIKFTNKCVLVKCPIENLTTLIVLFDEGHYNIDKLFNRMKSAT